MGFFHGVDDIGASEDGSGEQLRLVAMEVNAAFAADADGLGSGGHAGGGASAGGGDVEAFFGQVVDLAAEFFGEGELTEGFGHGAAAGVSGADEEDVYGPHSTNSGRVKNAFAEDFDLVGPKTDDGGGFGVSGGSCVEGEVDLAVEGVEGIVKGGRSGMARGVGGGGDDRAFGRGEDFDGGFVVGQANAEGAVVVETIAKVVAETPADIIPGGIVELKDGSDGTRQGLLDEAAVLEGEVAYVFVDVGAAGNVEGEGLVIGSLFDLREPFEGVGGVDLSADAIDGFGGEDDESALGPDLSGLFGGLAGVGGGVEFENLGLHDALIPGLACGGPAGKAGP